MGVRDTLHCWGLTLLILPGVLGDPWAVWYPEKPICAVRGSTVIITCQYTYPNTSMEVINVMWCKNPHNRCLNQTYVCHNIDQIKDQISDEFKNRAECLGDKLNSGKLKIKDIRNQDSGKYYFRFEGDGTTDKWFGEGGVELNVTELMVTSSRTTEPIKEGDNVTLTCATKNSCNINQSELTWLKDKTRIPGSPTILEFKFISHQNSGTYSCALKNNIKISSNEIIVAVQPKQSAELLIAILVGIVLTVLAVALVAIIYFKRRKAEAQTEDVGSTKGAQAAVNTSTAELPQPQSRGPAFSTQEEEVSYASVHFKKKKPKRSAQRQEQLADDSVIYSTLKN